MEMTRADLIQTVGEAARLAKMTDDQTARVVNAVTDPKVTRVARGDWTAYGESCPAQLAGLEPGRDRGVTFASKFDNLTRAAAVRAVQGRDPDDHERYVIKIV